jgi:hypothetical protein
VRPRLKVEPLSDFFETADTHLPIRWVSWQFETALSSMSLPSLAFSKPTLRHLSDGLLFAILEKGTSVLDDALVLSADIGWITKDFDRPNYSVNRVFEFDREDSKDDGDDTDDKDPDAHNNDFAPLVRLLGSGLSALASKNTHLAIRILRSWHDRLHLGGLFLRLRAFGAWDRRLSTASEVGKFLIDLPDHPFWRWTTFPEIATLRVTRWNDLDESGQIELSQRLLKGPDDTIFGREVDDETKFYHRDHEVARLVDSGAQVDERFHRIVEARRKSDGEFPARVPRTELGLSGFRLSSVSPGEPDKFNHVTEQQLLSTLVASQKTRGFGDGDHAEAFARTTNGKKRILEALILMHPIDALFAPSFDLLLSYPHEKPEDPLAERELAQRIVSFAIKLPLEQIEHSVSRLCYWLDAMDEKVGQLAGAEDLWVKLIPSAEKLANEKDHPEHYSGENDLTSAALNEPVGHLIAFAFRRCPPISEGKRVQLPRHLFEQLKHMRGRARELLANRMAVAMNYFILTDETLLSEIVIGAMMGSGPAGNRLWEAFARYSRVPGPKLWGLLEDALLKHMYSADLTPDARRRLSEMCVVVWTSGGKDYALEAARLRSALTLANDDVRAAVAWQFVSVFRTKAVDGGDDLPAAETWKRIGRRFFNEVWPLEPTLQSSASANDFAEIPAAVGVAHFADAVNVIAPFLVPFKVWSVKTEFGLEPSESSTKILVKRFADELLTLLSLSISENQGYPVDDLGGLLDQLLAFHPNLQTDYRMQRLRKAALRLA